MEYLKRLEPVWDGVSHVAKVNWDGWAEDVVDDGFYYLWQFIIYLSKKIEEFYKENSPKVKVYVTKTLPRQIGELYEDYSPVVYLSILSGLAIGGSISYFVGQEARLSLYQFERRVDEHVMVLLGIVPVYLVLLSFFS